MENTGNTEQNRVQNVSKHEGIHFQCSRLPPMNLVKEKIN